MYFVEENINDILDNLKTELDEIENISEVIFYDGEFINDSFKVNLTSDKATIFLDLVEIETFESEVQHGQDCRIYINMYVVAAKSVRAYDKSNKNTSMICINAIEAIKRKLRNNFLNVDLNKEIELSGARKILNNSEEKGTTSAYMMTLICEFTYMKDL